MNNKIIAIIVTALVLIAMILSLFYWKQPVQAPATQQETGGATQQKADTSVSPTGLGQDTTTAIDQELNKIDAGNLDKEFQGIDEDIKGL